MKVAVRTLTGMDQWQHRPFSEFRHVEHARWAAIFKALGIHYAYRPQHFGITDEKGIRPHFRIEADETYWFHCCSRYPSSETKVLASSVSHKTGYPFAIAVGHVFIPPADEMPMSLVVITGHSNECTRYIVERNRA